MVYPDTPGIKHILNGVPKLTESPSIEGGFWKVKWKGEKDAVLKAMSHANALIGKEMCESQDTILNMPSPNLDEKCKQIALQCGIRVDCSADERGALKLRGPKAQLLSALKSINEVLTSEIEKTLHLPDGKVIGKLPDTWEDMTPEQTVKKVPLDRVKNHDEYEEVQTLFLGRFQAEIVSIERIQNPSLYLPYAVKKYTMVERYRSESNGPEFECERKLFHGTREDATHMINAQGFNRGFAGKNAAHYGNGVYFAMNAKYSANDKYSVPDRVGNKYIYLSLVLTGKYTKGDGGMRTPPPKDPARPAELYDSVVNNMVNPTMFIVFNDSQAYPQYLITFKTQT